MCALVAATYLPLEWVSLDLMDRCFRLLYPTQAAPHIQSPQAHVANRLSQAAHRLAGIVTRKVARDAVLDLYIQDEEARLPPYWRVVPANLAAFALFKKVRGFESVDNDCFFGGAPHDVGAHSRRSRPPPAWLCAGPLLRESGGGRRLVRECWRLAAWHGCPGRGRARASAARDTPRDARPLGAERPLASSGTQRPPRAPLARMAGAMHYAGQWKG